MKSSVRVLAAMAWSVSWRERVREEESRDGAHTSSAASDAARHHPGTTAPTAARTANAATARPDRGRDLRARRASMT